VAAVEPSRLLASARTPLFSDDAPVYLIGAGKAAWPMAHAFVQRAARPPRLGLVAGPRVGGDEQAASLEWFDAGHPSPNQASVDAAARALEIARESRRAGGVLVVLLSGGASAMLTAPADGVSLADKVATARGLMNAGMAIGDLNCVRKHLSRIKGGQLAAAAHRTITVAISDVHGPIPDDPSVIGSGPTFPDPTTFAQALRIAVRFPGLPASVRRHLERGAQGTIAETIKPGDPQVAAATYEVLANRLTAVAGARAKAESLGYNVIALDDPIVGEARDAAAALVETAARFAKTQPGPLCVIASGETTVTVTGSGLGGRNQEFALAAAPALRWLDGEVLLASAGTDGADGPTDAAGAVADTFTIERSLRAGLDWRSSLANNDAYHFFDALGDLIRWGPTGTNVGDVQVFLRA
jgi:glycerate 2-kinase